MFDENSRYKDLPVKTHETADGRSIRYVARRFLADPGTFGTLARVRVSESERLDLLAHRMLGEPTQFWRIADANGAMAPDDLLRPVGRHLTIPTPSF